MAQLGPNWDHPILTLLTTIPGLIGTCLLQASRFHPAPGTLPSSLLPAGGQGTAWHSRDVVQVLEELQG